MVHPPYFMGIDGGGSKCKAILVDQKNNILGQGTSGPANPRFGLAQAMDSVLNAAQAALIDANLSTLSLSDIIAGIGLAGINLPYYYQQVLEWPHPFMKRHLTTDLHIACVGAHQKQDGAVIIVGTGSCGFSLCQGEKTELGGYGFPHGDKGSGAWLGLQAVSQALNALDGVEQKTRLCAPLLNTLQVNDAIGLSETLSEGTSATFAKLAPIVFDCANQNDPVSIAIIQDGAHYLDQLAKKLIADHQLPLVLIGGLKEAFLPWLEPFTLAHLQDSQASSEMGAIFWARSQDQSNTPVTFKGNI